MTIDLRRFPHTENEVIYDFKQCDYNLLNELISTTNWSILDSADNVNDAVERFYSMLFSIIHQNVPARRRRHKSYANQPWWNVELRNCRNRLRKARKLYFRHKSDSYKLQVLELERNYEALNAHHFRKYTENIEKSLKNDPKLFWSYINKRKNSSDIPANLFCEDKTATTPLDAANLFSSFFQRVLSNHLPPLDESYLNGLPVYNVALPPVFFTDDNVLAELHAVDPSKGPGSDQLPPLFIKNCASSLAHPAGKIFNRSLTEGVFPSAWKVASITPVYKSGNVGNDENYRGISILSCIPKVFERLIHDAVYSSIHNLISPCQHGFIRKRSTTSNLMSFIAYLFDNMQQQNQTDSIYIDFRKAFDKVPHILAVEKLKRMGFPPWLYQWVLSYLTDRTAFVKIGTAQSNRFKITSGVPQGSILGPMLFILFVNDLDTVIQSPKLFFADDLKIFRTVEDRADCLALLYDIDAVSSWCRKNGMEVNTNKSYSISFTRKKSPVYFEYTFGEESITRVFTVKDLGITLDTRLTFDEHISTSISKAYVTLGFIRRNTQNFKDIYCLRTLFCTHVRSILEYGIQVWAPFYAVHINRIEKVQKRFLRYALRRLPWNDPVLLPRYEHRCKLIDLPTLEQRRTLLQRLFVFDLLANNIDCNELLNRLPFNAPTRTLRHLPMFRLPLTRTVYSLNSPFVTCCRRFNEISNHFDFNITKETFKIRISRS